METKDKDGTHKYKFKLFVNGICNRDTIAVQGAYRKELLGESPNYKAHFGTAVYSDGMLFEYQRETFRSMIQDIYFETKELTEGRGVSADPAKIHKLLCHSHKV
jgi:hypothetical protein